MLTNGEVTILCLGEAQEEYVVKATVPAWVRHQSRLREQSGGVRRCDTYDVRIELGMIDSIEPGELIFFGRTKSAELKECRRIAAVRRNSFGITPHWHLEAEYMYR